MRNILFSFSFCLIAISSNAQSCQSIFSTLQNVFNDVFHEYQDMRKEVANILLGDEIGKVADVSLDFQTMIYDRANVIPGNGSSSVGPRYIYAEVGENSATGSLVTDRTFIAVPSGYDKLYVTITKTDGKAGGDFAACLKNGDGVMVNKKTKSIAKNSSDGKSVKFTFFNAEDKYLSVHLVKTLGLNKFEYKIKVTGEMNETKLEEETQGHTMSSNGSSSGSSNSSSNNSNKVDLGDYKKVDPKKTGTVKEVLTNNENVKIKTKKSSSKLKKGGN